MAGADKMSIKPTLGDIDRGVTQGTPKRILYNELSDIAKSSSQNVSKKGLDKVLTEYAEKIHEGSAGNNQRKCGD